MCKAKSAAFDRTRSTQRRLVLRTHQSHSGQTPLDSRAFRNRCHCLGNTSGNTAKSKQPWGCDENSQVKHARDRSAPRVSPHMQPIPHLRLFQTARVLKKCGCGDGTDTAPEHNGAQFNCVRIFQPCHCSTSLNTLTRQCSHVSWF